MSDLEDWDFDEEFLKDIDNKAVVFYSQDNNNKRQKLDSPEISYISTNNYFDNDSNKAYNHSKQSIQNMGTSRRHFILNTLKQENSSSPYTNEPLKETHDINKPLSGTSFNNTKYRKNPDTDMHVTTSRQKMIFDILQKKCVPNIEDQKRNLSNDKMPTTLLGQEASENTSLEVKNHSMKNHKMSGKASSREHNKSILPVSPSKMNRNSMSLEVTERKKFKVENVIKIPENSSSDLQCTKVTLIRKFAGPAGLLPDTIHARGISPACLKDIDEQNNSISDSANLGEMNCWSQNTKNLFTDGAWQMMLDNLSGNIKEKVINNKISLILQTARKEFKQTVRVEYFAGILENLQCHNNLVHFKMKDSTGSISAVTFYDVSVKYPDTFVNNAVILLHNVNVTRVFQSTQYRFVITPSNILGIYSDKGKIVTTEILRQVSNNFSNDPIDLDTISTLC